MKPQFFTILLVSLQGVMAYITFDQGSLQQVSASICSSTSSTIKTTTFSGTFQNIPQVIMAENNQVMKCYNEFTFEITNIATTSFTTKFECMNTNSVWSLYFRWAAVDDNRIEVINVFKLNVTTQGDTIFSHALTNPNLKVGVVSIFGGGQTATTKVQMEIQSITYNQVTVSYTTSAIKMLNFGYQVILGTTEAMILSSLISTTTIQYTSVQYNGGPLTIPTGYKLILPLSGVGFNTNHDIRFQSTYTETATTISYTFKTFSSSNIDLLEFREVWLNTQNTKYLQPLFCKKARVSQLFDKNISSKPLMSLSITELNKLYTTTITTDSNIFIDNTIQTINIVIQFTCSNGMYVQFTMLRCMQCSTQNQVIEKYCFGGGINQLTFYIQLLQSDVCYQFINVQVTSTGYIITQQVVDETTQTYTILNIQKMTQ